MIRLKIAYTPEHNEEELHISFQQGDEPYKLWQVIGRYNEFDVALPDNFQIKAERKLKYTVKA